MNQPWCYSAHSFNTPSCHGHSFPLQRRAIIMAIFRGSGTNCMVPLDWDLALSCVCGPTSRSINWEFFRPISETPFLSKNLISCQFAPRVKCPCELNAHPPTIPRFSCNFFEPLIFFVSMIFRVPSSTLSHRFESRSEHRFLPRYLIIKVGLGILQITLQNDVRRFGRGLALSRRSLFSTNFVEFDQAV